MLKVNSLSLKERVRETVTPSLALHCPLSSSKDLRLGSGGRGLWLWCPDPPSIDSRLKGSQAAPVTLAHKVERTAAGRMQTLRHVWESKHVHLLNLFPQLLLRWLHGGTAVVYLGEVSIQVVSVSLCINLVQVTVMRNSTYNLNESGNLAPWPSQQDCQSVSVCLFVSVFVCLSAILLSTWHSKLKLALNKENNK